MALEDGVLYALIGEQEQRDPVIRLRSTGHGWPWDPLSPGYNRPEHTWGFGRTLLAIDPQTKQVLWRYEEPEPIDSRALCMSHGRIYAFRSDAYLTCLDAKTGTAVWRKTPQNDGACSRPGHVPQTPGLADELAHDRLSQVQRPGALFRRARRSANWSRCPPPMATCSGSSRTATTSWCCATTGSTR